MLPLPELSSLLSIATIIFSKVPWLKGKAMTPPQALEMLQGWEGGYGPLRVLDTHLGTSQTRHEGLRDKVPSGYPGMPSCPMGFMGFLAHH